MEENSGNFLLLPEGCISHVLSLTSPRDSCRSAAVSTAFRSAADSDTVWERFLPSDYEEILDRAEEPMVYSSKRDLYFKLCDPILIDGGKMSFALEKSTGAKCYMVSARELGIVWGDTAGYWNWISVKDSGLEARFSEVAHLLNVCWLEIHGKIDCRILSRKTNYAAYFVFKLDETPRGLSFPHQEASVKVGPHESKRSVRMQPSDAAALPRANGLFGRIFNRMVDFIPNEETADGEDIGVPCLRGDGWFEIEMGEFFNGDGDDGEVDMSLMEIKGGHWKKGLIVLGIELRPKRSGTERASTSGA